MQVKKELVQDIKVQVKRIKKEIKERTKENELLLNSRKNEAIKQLAL